MPSNLTPLVCILSLFSPQIFHLASPMLETIMPKRGTGGLVASSLTPTLSPRPQGPRKSWGQRQYDGDFFLEWVTSHTKMFTNPNVGYPYG